MNKASLAVEIPLVETWTIPHQWSSAPALSPYSLVDVKGSMDNGSLGMDMSSQPIIGSKGVTFCSLKQEVSVKDAFGCFPKFLEHSKRDQEEGTCKRFLCMRYRFKWLIDCFEVLRTSEYE